MPAVVLLGCRQTGSLRQEQTTWNRRGDVFDIKTQNKDLLGLLQRYVLERLQRSCVNAVNSGSFDRNERGVAKEMSFVTGATAL